MSVFQFPINHGKIFFIFAMMFSVYFAIRAIFIQLDAFKKDSCICKFVFMWVLWDMNFNFVGSAAGWSALYLLSYYAGKIKNINTAGGGIVFVFLILLSITGISGMLPQMLVQGKLPGFGKN